MKRKIITLLCSGTLMVALSITSFAAYTSFSGYLPMNGGDREMSTVAKSTDGTAYFTVNPKCTNSNYTHVCAWTEKPALGTNYSTPAKQVLLNATTNVEYSISTPAAGASVTLNLDNPVHDGVMIYVTGRWTPN